MNRCSVPWGWLDEFAHKIGVQSIICWPVAKFADKILLHGQKCLVFETSQTIIVIYILVIYCQLSSPIYKIWNVNFNILCRLLVLFNAFCYFWLNKNEIAILINSFLFSITKMKSHFKLFFFSKGVATAPMTLGCALPKCRT